MILAEGRLLLPLELSWRELSLADYFPRLFVPGGAGRSTAAPFSTFALLRWWRDPGRRQTAANLGILLDKGGSG
ncbi:uncharacterized protein LOC119167883 isoform X2 [Rhipicephalus microplus]|uniref:uncharacterized protein LOC119167883 isoform X2 n=1 Tax=Rhipicephalus microplus TaxID=6941 RepID=UPI003F6D717A